MPPALVEVLRVLRQSRGVEPQTPKPHRTTGAGAAQKWYRPFRGKTGILVRGFVRNQEIDEGPIEGLISTDFTIRVPLGALRLRMRPVVEPVATGGREEGRLRLRILGVDALRADGRTLDDGDVELVEALRDDLWPVGAGFDLLIALFGSGSDPSLDAFEERLGGFNEALAEILQSVADELVLGLIFGTEDSSFAASVPALGIQSDGASLHGALTVGGGIDLRYRGRRLHHGPTSALRLGLGLDPDG